VDEQDEDREPEAAEPITERVRIVGAEPAGVLAGDQPPPSTAEPGDPEQREQRYLGFVHHSTPPPRQPEPPPPPDTSHLAAVSPELPHWSDPPTGQVPAIIDRRGEESDDAFDSGPVWREHEHEWEDTGGFEPSMLADDQTRVGALDETPLEERRPWEFDDLGSSEAGEDDQGPSGDGGPGADQNRAFDEMAVAGPDDRTAEQPVVRGSWDKDLGGQEVLSDPFAPPAGGDAYAGEEGTARGEGAASWWDEQSEDGGWAGEATAQPSPSSPTDPSLLTTAAVPVVSEALASSSGADAAAAEMSTSLASETAAREAATETWPASEVSEGSPTATRDFLTAVEEPGRPPARPAAATLARRTTRPPLSTAPPAGGQRNVPVALATGIGVAGVVVGCLYAGPIAIVVLAAVAFTLAAAEVYAALRRAGRHPATLLGLVATIALMASAYSKGVTALPLVTALLVTTVMVWYLVGADRSAAVDGISSTLLVFGWVAVLGSFVALMAAPSIYPNRQGLAFLLGAVVATVAADVGALVVGSWLGRHQLAPHVSPNKTWEGWVGGAVLAVAASVVITGRVHPWTPGKAAVLGVVIAVLAPVGDLCESLVKRDLGVKDLGSLLPGHGGVIDRVDGLLFALPATYYLVRLLHLG